MSSDRLDAMSSWPVRSGAGAVVTPSGVGETHGDVDHVYELASVTKLLSTYAFLIAVEEEAIDLDGPAGPAGSTVRHLLAHASGLAFAERKAQSAPGEKRIYSSAGFEVLADHLTEQTSIRFDDYLREAVFEPLAMSSSELAGSPGHGARSTVADLARFAGELLRPTLVSADTMREATSVQFPGLAGILPGYGTQRPNDWGLGFEIRSGKSPHWTGRRNSVETVGHFGQSGTFVWMDPRAEVACVVLTDRDFGDWAKPLWPDLSDEILPES